MFGMFKVEKKIETPAEEQLEEIKQLLFPPLELHEKYDEASDEMMKYHVDYSVDSNLESALSDLEDGYNDDVTRATIRRAINTLADVRKMMEAYWQFDKDAKYIIVNNDRGEEEIDVQQE